MYMTQPQLEQLIKDRRESALNSARSIGNVERRKYVPRARRLRTTTA